MVRHRAGRPRLIEDEAPAARSSGLERLPEDLLSTLVQAVVGFELPITRLEGKWKLNQNRSVADRRGMVAALRRQGDPLEADVAALMATGLESDD